MLPPDINQSQLHFTVVPEGVRFGLTAIKGLGEGAIRAIIEVRERTGDDHVAPSALRRARSAHRQQEGARSAGEVRRVRQPRAGRRRRLPAGRAKLFGAVDSAIEHGNRTQRDRELGQSDLFGGGDDNNLSIIRLPDSPPGPRWSC